MTSHMPMSEARRLAGIAIAKVDKGPRWREHVSDDEIDAMAIMLLYFGVDPVDPGPLPDQVRGAESRKIR